MICKGFSKDFKCVIMRFGAFPEIKGIGILLREENAQKLKSVHSRGILQQKRASEEAQNNEEICI